MGKHNIIKTEKYEIKSKNLINDLTRSCSKELAEFLSEKMYKQQILINSLADVFTLVCKEANMNEKDFCDLLFEIKDVFSDLRSYEFGLATESKYWDNDYVLCESTFKRVLK
jgi:hypothetical protein